MEVQGLRIGQTWFTVTSDTITKYTLEGYVPGRDIFIVDIKGKRNRIFNEDFSKLDLIDKRTDAVIAKDALKLAEINEFIGFTEEELTKLKAARDGFNN